MSQALTHPDGDVQIDELPNGKRRLTYRKIKWLLQGLLAVIKALSGMTLVPNLSLVIQKDSAPVTGSDTEANNASDQTVVCVDSHAAL